MNESKIVKQQHYVGSAFFVFAVLVEMFIYLLGWYSIIISLFLWHEDVLSVRDDLWEVMAQASANRRLCRRRSNNHDDTAATIKCFFIAIGGEELQVGLPWPIKQDRGRSALPHIDCHLLLENINYSDTKITTSLVSFYHLICKGDACSRRIKWLRLCLHCEDCRGKLYMLHLPPRCSAWLGE
jgi:hypothetical protein